MAHDELLCLGWLGQGQFGEMPTLVAQVWDVDALQAEQDRQLPTMMQVVGHDAPDYPLARNRVHLALVEMPVGLRQVGDRPGGERGIDHLPAYLQPPEQFGGVLNDSRLLLFDRIKLPAYLSEVLCIGLFPLPGGNMAGEFSPPRRAYVMEPVQPSQSDMADNLAHRAQVRRGSPGQLFGCQRGDRPHQRELVTVPPFENTHQ